MTQNRRSFLALAGLGTAAALSSPRALFAAAPAYRLSQAEWRKRLTPEQYHILREAGTERPFTSPLNKEHRAGVFFCAGCDQPLFTSRAKFESGTGWPSFFMPIRAAVATRADNSMMMRRTEVICSRCDGHLGHVFDDGPPPTGKRYCMNGDAMTFRARA